MLHTWLTVHGPLSRYAKLRVAHSLGMLGAFSSPLRVTNPDMHHGTCVTHVLWCMPGSLTSRLFWSQWQGKRSQHPQHMRNPQFYVSKCPFLQYLRGQNKLSEATAKVTHRKLLSLKDSKHISKDMLTISIFDMTWKMTDLELLLHLQGPNKLMTSALHRLFSPWYIVPQHCVVSKPDNIVLFNKTTRSGYFYSIRPHAEDLIRRRPRWSGFNLIWLNPM